MSPSLLTAPGATPVVCVRGPSRSGKSSLCERLITRLETRGIHTGYIKRTHHPLDLPAKASGRIWAAGPTAMLLRTPDRLQLTVATAGESAAGLVEALPLEVDLVILETHTSEPYPTILSRETDPEPGEQVICRWSLDSLEADAVVAAAAVSTLLPVDRELARQLRRVLRFHGGCLCVGLILGTRLAVHGAGLLGITLPDAEGRLVVVAETQRCAADALQAVTGCRPGRRTLQLRDYGKLAATFIDVSNGRAVRVAVRPEFRSRAAAEAAPGEPERSAEQRLALEAGVEELFAWAPAVNPLDASALPGPIGRRVVCDGCGEEVADGRDMAGRHGRLCRPCALAEHTFPTRRTA